MVPKNNKKAWLFLLILISVLLLCLIYWFTRTPQPTYINQGLSLPQVKVTPIAKEQALSPIDEWTHVKIQQGDSLASIFKRLKFKPQILQTILADNPRNNVLSTIKAGQELKFLIKNNALEKLTIPINQLSFLSITHQGEHYPATVQKLELTTHQQFISATIYGSLLTTAQRMGIANKLIRQMIEILGRDINFSKDVKSGDQFSLIYNAFYLDGKEVDTGEIIALRYTHQGKTHEAYRHKTVRGDYDYFSPQGLSLKKAFSRYPVHFSHISSTFSLYRMHPILHYNRPHKGIDLAAPLGTPIHTIGNGHVVSIGRQGGYGNMIKIIHDQTYTTVYGHLLKFAKGLHKGSYVKKDQVIGYVGQTGLASGPHCHYEIHVNRNPKNPATINLPQAASIPNKEMANFKAEASIMLARLKLFEDGNMLASNRPTTDG